MMTSTEPRKSVRVVSFTVLKALNDTAILRNYNRSFVWDELVDVISTEHTFPLHGMMLHDYGSGTAV